MGCFSGLAKEIKVLTQDNTLVFLFIQGPSPKKRPLGDADETGNEDYTNEDDTQEVLKAPSLNTSNSFSNSRYAGHPHKEITKMLCFYMTWRGSVVNGEKLILSCKFVPVISGCMRTIARMRLTGFNYT